MASVAPFFSLGHRPSTSYCSKFHTSSQNSSIHSIRISIWSVEFNSKRMPLTRRRCATVACSALAHDAGMWTSMQPQLKNYWFLLCPSILVPLLALSAETRQLLRTIPDLTRSAVSNLASLLYLHSAQWREVRRCAVQISAVLALANALHSDIAPPDPNDTFENVPQDISGGEVRKRIQKPKSKKAERCTQKCLGTCIQGGAGSPGEGPFNIRKPLVVFKEGFRTRLYCLIECSDICNLIGDGDDGP